MPRNGACTLRIGEAVEWGEIVVDRRAFLKASAASAGGALILPTLGGCTNSAPIYAAPGNGTPFTLGVLSGLHSPTEVVLWTRIEPALVPGIATLDWTISSSPAMSDVVATGSVAVGPGADHTAKVLVGGLEADRSYWYRFAAIGSGQPESPVGRARTLPPESSDPTSLKLVYASCQNWQTGWYNAWSSIATEDVDAVLWLGDYIYESGGFSLRDVRRDTVGSSSDLASYRAKYRLYRSDPALQRAHSAHPFVPVWDDHEFRDNYSTRDMALEPARTAAAYQAWFDYMPVWPIAGTRIHRNLRWGRLAEMFMLDTRQYRDPQAGAPRGPFVGAGGDIAEAARPGRSILGASQRRWLLDGLTGAQTDAVRWKLLGNQVMISPVRPFDLDTPELRRLNSQITRHDGVYLNLDSWDSYFDERDHVLAHLADQRISDVAFLTGDIHTFWQSTLRADYDDDRSPLVANEFVGGSITSSGPNVLGAGPAAQIEQAVTGQWSPAFRYVDFRRNGYGMVECTDATLTVSYRTTEVFFPGTPTATSTRFVVTSGTPTPTMQPINP